MDQSKLKSEVQRAASRIAPRRQTWQLYLATIAIVAICSLAGFFSHILNLTSANVVMIFLSGVVFVAVRFGHGPAIACAILSVLVFDFFFVEPIYSFAPSDAQYLVDLFVMLGVGLLISELTAKLQSQLDTSRQQERLTAQLYQMTRQLDEMVGRKPILESAVRQLAEISDADVSILIADGGKLKFECGSDFATIDSPNRLSAANFAVEQKHPAGWTTDKFADCDTLFLPLIASGQALGVVAVLPARPRPAMELEQRRMLEACVNLVALAIERDRILQTARDAEVQVKSEQLRNALLSSVSHDLRTPLAMIAVTASGLIDESAGQTLAAKQEMLETIVDESHRLSRQVDNLLDMARLDAGTIDLNREWHVLEEMVGVALARMRHELKDRTVQVKIPADFPLLWVADNLFEQVLINLLDNAVRYTRVGSRIDISANVCGSNANIEVSDNGPGLPPGTEHRVFDKFFRASTKVADGQRGVGLGLAICQGIIQAHGGNIVAANRPEGGAVFTISLPLSESAAPANLEESNVPANV